MKSSYFVPANYNPPDTELQPKKIIHQVLAKFYFWIWEKVLLSKFHYINLNCVVYIGLKEDAFTYTLLVKQGVGIDCFET